MACSHSTSCPLFAQFQLNTTLRSWKIMYCDSDTRSRNCHRFKLSESGHAVPLNLLPNGTMLEIEAGAAAGQCGPATPIPAVRERVAAPAPEPALAVAERVAPAPAPAAAPPPVLPAVAASNTNAATPPQRVAPAAMPAQAEAPAALQRARSILDRILGRKG